MIEPFSGQRVERVGDCRGDEWIADLAYAGGLGVAVNELDVVRHPMGATIGPTLVAGLLQIHTGGGTGEKRIRRGSVR